MTPIKNEMKKQEKKIIDAQGRTLGRVASEIAMSLMGKTRPSFERNIYSGVPVRVINAAKLRITPKKLATIYHTRYSGIPDGLRIVAGSETVEKKGLSELIRLATYQMLPANKLRKKMMINLHIED